MLSIKNIPIFLHSSLLASRRVVYLFAKEIEVKTGKKIILSKKKNKQLIELKKELSKKEPVKSEDLYQQFHFRDVYKRINIQLESFFFERPYNLQNFNFLLNLIGEQAPSDFRDRVDQVLNKMALMNIKPDEKSYNYMIKAAANLKDVQLAQQYFKQACDRFLPNKYLYTSLMQAYVINNDPNMALKLVDQMIQKGLEPDLPTYTTLVNCFRKGRRLQKCWQVHKKMKESKIQPDETYTGVMMKVYAATHDAEKAVKLYRENITQAGIKPMIETTNAYFKALSSRRQYSSEVVDKFFQLVEKGQIVTTETANWALRACSTIGNVKSAGEILKIMKMKEITIDKTTLSVLLRVYATACLVPDQDQKFRDIIITDSWKLLEQIERMGGVDTKVLNNMLTIYANSLNSEQIDGLILPLFDKFKQPYNMYTFQILMKLYYKTAEFETAMRVWKQMQKKIQENQLVLVDQTDSNRDIELHLNKMNENLRPTFNALHAYLEIGIKMLDMNQVLDALSMFKKYKRMPRNETLKFLGTLKNLPQQIQVALMQFQIQFGKAKLGKKQLGNIEDPQNK